MVLLQRLADRHRQNGGEDNGNGSIEDGGGQLGTDCNEGSIQGHTLTLAFYLLLWGIFTLVMFIGTLKHNRATQVVFGSLTVLFFLLAIGDFTGNHTITTIAGFEGIFCGLSAVYNAMGQILNAEFGKKIIPLG